MDKNKCIECGKECHCKETIDESCQCNDCNCMNKAMDRDGEAQVFIVDLLE